MYFVAPVVCLSLEQTLTSSTTGERALLITNHAIARAAIEAGVGIATGYPGTPASEVIEALGSVADACGMHVEWAVNEKVALESASAAAIVGVRGMTVMKHVGLNVASDILMVLCLTGVKAGMVIVVGDDPGAWVSQNEQDSRLYAHMADVPMFEPSSAQEALTMTRLAFDVSERIQLPVFVRTTMKVSHSSGIVRFGPIAKPSRKVEYVRDIPRYKTQDVYVQALHEWQHNQMKSMRKLLPSLKMNKLSIKPGQKLGIVASGAAYNYSAEAVYNLGLQDKVAILKVETAHPLPDEKMKTLLQRTRKLLVVEEVEPLMENHLRQLAYELPGGHCATVLGRRTGDLPETSELSYEIVASSLARLAGVRINRDKNEATVRDAIAKAVPPRGLTFCPGCPHMGTFYALKLFARKTSKRKIANMGDIGCYEIAAFPPLEINDSSFCMGASIAQASGLAYAKVDLPIFASIGDSTFFHSGIPALIDAALNNAHVCVLICDNETTAMTGHQPHPGTGLTATGKATKKIRIEDIAKAAGIEFVEVTNAFDIMGTYRTIDSAVKHAGPSVIISRGRCAELTRREARRAGTIPEPYAVDLEKCKGCMVCTKEFGCAAITWNSDMKKAIIEPTLCVGCGLCEQVCMLRAIAPLRKS
jgi:indolepyruvate ferredoxin oxidoreductase alpha subunit